MNDIFSYVKNNYKTLRVRKIKLSKGVVLCHEGEPANSVFLIAKGFLRVVKSTPKGNELVISEIGSGDTAGEMGVFLEDRRRTATLISKTDCEIWELDSESFLKILEQNHNLYLSLLKEISERMRYTNEKIIDFFELEALGRAAKTILRIAERESQKSQYKEDYISISLNVADMSREVGVSRETISRCLKRMRREGALLKVRKKTFKASIPKLKKFLEQ